MAARILLNTIFFFLLTSGHLVYSQCGCTDCPLLVADLTPAMIPVEVSGVINDDLSHPLQGVCEVRLEFTHDDVGDWTIDLISPSGQMVQLKGPYTLCGFSDGDLWRVSFVPCDSTAIPDPPNPQQPAGFSEVWDNCEFESTFDVLYTGSYYPTIGCLEDFNTGPVNGTWIINSFDNRDGDEGELLGFELIFCDPGNIECETVVCAEEVIAIIIPSDTVVCPDGEVVLDGSTSVGPGLEYTWSAITGNITSPVNDVTATISGPGRYVLEVSYLGPEGVYCRGWDTLDITLSSVTIPEAQIDDLFTIDCDSPQIHLVAEILVTSGNDGFEWQTMDGNIVNGQGSRIIEVDQAGTYNLFVYNDEGCGNDYTITVEEDFIEPDIIFDFNQLNCLNNLSTELNVNLGSTNETYEWAGPDITSMNMTEQSPTIGLPGMYHVTVTAENGCMRDSTLELQIDTITPLIEIDIILDPDCSNREQTLIVTSNELISTYLWSGPDVTPMNETNAVIDVVNSGTYFVTITGENGCPKRTSIELEALEMWPRDLMMFDSFLTCLRTEVILGPTIDLPPYDFLWTGPGINVSNETQKNPVVNIAGNYTLVVTNDRDCSFPYHVEIEWDTMSPQFDTLPYVFDCDDEFVLIGIVPQGLVNVNWTGPGILPDNQDDLVQTIRSGGYFEVTVDGENGCTAVKGFEVIKAGNIPDLMVSDVDTLTCDRSIVTLEASSMATVSYLWTGPDIDVSNETEQNPDISLPGTYEIVVTDPFGCKNSTSVVVTIDTTSARINEILADTITCSVLTTQILLTVDAGNEFTWTGPGITAVNEKEQNPVVDVGGNYQVTISTGNGCQTMASLNIIELKNIPSLSLDAGGLSCAIDSVIINAIAPEAIVYNWSGPGINMVNENDENPVIRIPGTYVLEITDANGCVNSRDIIIPIDSIRPDISLTAPTITCDLTAIQINNVSDGLNFFWTGAGITLLNEREREPMVNMPGLYEVIATGLNGCERIETIDVNIDTIAPTHALSSDVITCTNSEVSLSLITDGTEVSWTGPDINAGNMNEFSPQISIPGNYLATITGSNGCETLSAVDVVIDTISPNAIITSSSITNTITCEERTIELDGMSSMPTGSISYEWSRVGGGINPIDRNNPQIEIQNEGIYQLSITDNSNGCSNITQIEITEDGNFPSIRIQSFEELNCERRTLSIDASNSFGASTITFNWIGPGIIGSTDNAVIDINEPGIYTLTIEDDFNNCSSDTTIEIMENVVYPEINMAQIDELNCNRDVVQLSFTSNTDLIDVTWSGPGITSANEKNLRPVVSQPGNYMLTLRDFSNECVSTDVVEVVLIPAPSELITTVSPPNCEDEFSGVIEILDVVDAVNPIRYFINGIEQESPYLDLTDGEYIVKIIDANNCELSDTIKFTIPEELIVELGEDFQISLGQEINLTPTINRDENELASVLWNSIQTILCDTCFQLNHLPFTSDQYLLQVSDIYGCNSSDDIWIFVSRDNTIYVPNAFSPNSDGINDVFEIYHGQAVAEILNLKIYNRWGSKIYESHSTDQSDIQWWNGRFGLENAENGTYIYSTTFRLINGETISRSGEFSLIR